MPESRLPAFLRNPVLPAALLVAAASSAVAFLPARADAAPAEAAQAEVARTAIAPAAAHDHADGAHDHADAGPMHVAQLGSALAGAAADRDTLIQEFVGGFTGGTIDLSEATGEVREFVLEVHQITSEIAPGVEVEQWAFAFPGEEPSVPGPEIRVTEGDLVRITLRNTHDQPHSVHPHGITSNAMEADGVMSTSFHILPGQEYTYEFVAKEPGTHAYHCHVATNLHLDMGMYGAIIVEPADAEPVHDVEYSLTLDEWDADQDPSAPIHVSEPDYFLVNGKAYPSTESLEVLEGQVALFRVTNVGYQPHSLHLHGMSFLVVAKDGYDLPQPYKGDTLPILPGERYDILVKGRDGSFPFHDHNTDSVTNAGVYPGGMLALVTGSEARRTSDDPESVYHGREAVPGPIAQTAASADAGHDHADPAAHGAAETPAPAAGAGEVLSGEVEMAIRQFAFERPVITVKAGTTVTWTNEDAAPHTVTSGLPGADPASRAFDSTGAAEGRMDMMEQGDSWSSTFDEVGEFDYYCLPHPFMTAKVIVVE